MKEPEPNFDEILAQMGVLYEAGDLQGLQELLGSLEEAMRSHAASAALAERLEQVADVHRMLGNIATAGQRYQEALAIRDTLDPSAPQILETLTALTLLYGDAGYSQEALPFCRRAFEIRRQSGEADNETLGNLRYLALLHEQIGDWALAEQLYRELLGLTERTLGDPDTASVLTDLADLLRKTGDLSQAESLLARALLIEREACEDGDPVRGTSLNALGRIHMAKAEPIEAKALFEESLRIHSVRFPETHPEVIADYNNLALAHMALGNYPAAEKLFLRARDLWTTTAGEKSPLLGLVLSNLTELYRKTKDFTRAVAFGLRAIEGSAVAFGEDHPNTATACNNLALIYLEKGDPESALPLLERSLKSHRAYLPDGHPDLITSLSNLGAAQRNIGNYEAALSTLSEASAEALRTLGESHPATAVALANLATLRATQRHFSQALELMERSELVNDQLIGRILPGATEGNALAWLKSVGSMSESFLSLVVQRLSDSPQAIRSALDLVLRRKAIVFEVLARQRERARAEERSGSQSELCELAEQRRLLTEHTLAGPGLDGIEAHRQVLATLTARVEEKEEALVRRVPAANLARHLLDADRQRLAAALPPKAALIEFVSFDLFDFTATGEEPPWTPGRYLAFVLNAGDPEGVHAFDLGIAREIDEKIEAFRNDLISPRSLEQDLDHDGTALRKALFDPLRVALRDCQQLLIAPDGKLHQLPFETLPNENGGRLLDLYGISYLGTGRDLLRATSRPRAQGANRNAVVAADPDYDLVGGAPASTLPPATVRFKPLPGARREGIEVARALGVKPLLGRKVLKSTLQSLQGPGILHIATHGVFLPATQRSDAGIGRGLVPEGPWRGPGLTLWSSPPENPLLRSFLALAGANMGLRGGPLPTEAGNGLLFATDVLDMDLHGTELVVLSACETGLGDTLDREGVYGLRRSFLLAGSQTLVTSLWKIPDKTTRELMLSFYRAIREGVPRSEALRQAQLQIRQQKESSHPFYWGAFVCIGDPGVLPFSPANTDVGSRPSQEAPHDACRSSPRPL